MLTISGDKRDHLNNKVKELSTLNVQQAYIITKLSISTTQGTCHNQCNKWNGIGII